MKRSLVALTFSLFLTGCADFADMLGVTIKSSRESKQEVALQHDPEATREEGSKTSETGISSAEGNPRFSWPVDGPVTSLFGHRRGRPHDGIDISVPRGTPVRAARQGSVIHAGRLSGYGNLVIVKHESNYYTAYAHLASLKTTRDKRVKQGQVVGLAGRTGRSKGSHLHFELRHQTKPLNPLDFLPDNRFGVRQQEGGED